MSDGKASRASKLKKLLAQRSIILVSNRGPVQFSRDSAGELQIRRGGGGLVTAMTTISKETSATWISAAMNETERSLAREGSTIGFPKDNPLYQIRIIDIPQLVYHQYYNIISNPLIWFINHYMWNLAEDPTITPEVHKAWNEGYVVANKLFAKAAVEESRTHENPLIMLQDYHLFLAAKYIRELDDRPFLFHFTHIPWAEPDYLSVLPHSMRVLLIEGMLSNDLIGFQTKRYADNFLLCCEKLLGCHVNRRRRTVAWQGREVFVRVYPISIDHESLKETSNTDEVLAREAKLVEKYEDLSLIVRTDRSDLSKNVVRGFRAFEMLLNKRPELKKKVVFLALLYPTRENISEYQAYRKEIEAVVNEINELHGADGWTPIYLRMKDDYAQSVAALKQYDVLLVNPIFDGMNLVSKEGPVINRRNGVLILSENAGASAELASASLVVNPFDVEGTADAMYRALTMPTSERKMRYDYLREIVARNSSVKWLHYQLKDINNIEKRRTRQRLPVG